MGIINSDDMFAGEPGHATDGEIQPGRQGSRSQFRIEISGPTDHSTGHIMNHVMDHGSKARNGPETRQAT